VVERFGP